MLYILFRNDDPCGVSDPAHERRICQLFEKYNIPHVAAVIPKMVDDPHNVSIDQYHWLHENPAMVDLLKEYHSKGLLEIAQHGFTHQTNRFRPTSSDQKPGDFFQGINKTWLPYLPESKEGYSEFSGLPIEEQRNKIRSGKKYLEELFDISLDTFIFPWNTYDANTLKALKENHFKVVPTDTAPIINKDLNVLGAYNWDVKKYPSLVKYFSTQKSIFFQLGFHSWMLDEKEIDSLDQTLQMISNKRNIMCLTANQIPSVLPHIKQIAPIARYSDQISLRISPFLTKPIEEKRNYDCRILFNIKNVLTLGTILFTLKYIGMQKIFLGSLLLFLATLVVSLIQYQQTGSISLLNFIGTLFFVGLTSLSLLLRQKFHMLSY